MRCAGKGSQMRDHSTIGSRYEHFHGVTDGRKHFGLVIIEDGKRSLSIADITGDEDAIIRFCRLLNESELDPVHIFDVLEDELPLQ